MSYKNENFEKRIEMYFGEPNSHELFEVLKGRALERSQLLENTLLEEFELVCNSMQEEKAINYEGVGYRVNIFDSHSVIHSDIEGVFFSPPVEFGKYSKDKSIYPMLKLEDGYLRDKDGLKKFPLTGKIVTTLGKEYEKYFGFEFIGFNRF